jgi:hypothetical protein
VSATSRSDVTSSFTLIKGALIDDTYAVLRQWDFDRSKKQNLDHLRESNFIGARSHTWLRDVAKVINRRFTPSGRDRALTVLAKSECSLEEWKPILLWHVTRDEFLLRDFLQHWLFTAHAEGVFRLRPQHVEPYLWAIRSRGGRTEHRWSDRTTERVAVGLLKIASDFGLLRGTSTREFASYHLPERSFIYILHALRDADISPSAAIASREWRMFLMSPADVERELLRLHQFRRLDYHVAGSLVELSLPARSALEYAEGMVA